MGCGLKHTVVLLEDGKLVSCGNNEKGQLGQDQSVTRPGMCVYVCILQWSLQIKDALGPGIFSFIEVSGG